MLLALRPKSRLHSLKNTKLVQEKVQTTFIHISRNNLPGPSVSVREGGLETSLFTVSAEVGRPIFGPVYYQNVADQRTGKNNGPVLVDYRIEISLFRCSEFFGPFLKIFQREEIIK
jgi:hypothetical protein